MEQTTRLSQREKEVVDLVLQGKSNKQIASSLYISVRTVEFHLKNIYDKHQVSCRIELILKLGKAAGDAAAPQLGYSTVAGALEDAHTMDKHSQSNRVAFFRMAVGGNNRGAKAKHFLRFKNVLVAAAALLFSGFFWITVFAVLLGKAVP